MSISFYNTHSDIDAENIKKVIMNIWEQLDRGARIERKEQRESVCGVDHWIKSMPSGERIIKPYHCNTCDNCLRRKGLEISSILQSIENLKYIVAKPKSVDVFVKSIDTKNYARFPSQNGYDYLFSVDGVGKPFDKDNIDWLNVAKRRDGTRKSGKLILITDKKEQTGQTVEVSDIKALSYDSALDALIDAEKFFEKSGINNKEANTLNEVTVINNAFNIKILQNLEKNGDSVFTYSVKREVDLPVFLKFTITDSKESAYG